MGTATGFTAERMLAIENSTVVDGEIEGDNLILITRDGTPINAGPVRGPTGPSGPDGGGSGFIYEQSFAVATNTWTIIHGQGTKGVNVYTENSVGTEIEGDVTYPDVNTVQIKFYFPQTGLARVFN